MAKKVADSKFIPGQRWVSETEPELGLGTIIAVSERTLDIHFGAAEVTRCYAASSAPLRRARYQVGDRVLGRDGISFEVREVEETDGVCVYRGATQNLSESALSDRLGFNTPKARLVGGQVDPNPLFDLRYETLRLQHRIRKSPVRGFVGGRIEPIAHQFYIAHEVASRQAPRVLLADETGLGKTIEACLILHRLLLSGRVGRVLILVPESLVHQWFVELLRRFNLTFKIFDEPRCRSIEHHDPVQNPFLDEQLIISAIDLVGAPKRAEQILAVPWDLLIVDEAHHINEGSPTYGVLAAIASKTRRLLLLTATPDQLGPRNHFARLRLLDPERYFDLDRYLDEVDGYRRIAGLADRLASGQPLSDSQVQPIIDLLSINPDFSPEAFSLALQEDSHLRRQVLEALIDRHGTGRVFFRNTRRTVGGFPFRKAHLCPLGLEEDDDARLELLAETFAAETKGRQSKQPPDFDRDPRIGWLVGVLKKFRQAKILLICHSVAKTRAVEHALAKQMRVNTALFHEEMSLLQRDRNAAWFARADGARMLICSEIGSEGRNFQFAQHLVLFDLPLDPEVLEQRIGRLDRVGQQGTIHIHLPYIRGSVQEVLARWHHEGLDALVRNFPGGHQIKELLGEKVRTLALNYHIARGREPEGLDALIHETANARRDLEQTLNTGRDRLLELCACRPQQAQEILRQVARVEQAADLGPFMERIFAHYGIDMEEAGPRTYQLKPNLRFEETFPSFRGDFMAITFDRSTALANEHLNFLTWDHPMVSGGMELLLGSSTGNCTLVIWPHGDSGALLLEAIFVLECVAPAQLHGERFLPATPLRVVVDQDGQRVSAETLTALEHATLRDFPPERFHGHLGALVELSGRMITAAQVMSQEQAGAIIAQSLEVLRSDLDREIGRLVELARVNPNIREEELELVRQERDGLQDAISKARLRLDGLRLICSESIL